MPKHTSLRAPWPSHSEAPEKNAQAPCPIHSNLKTSFTLASVTAQELDTRGRTTCDGVGYTTPWAARSLPCAYSCSCRAGSTSPRTAGPRFPPQGPLAFSEGNPDGSNFAQRRMTRSSSAWGEQNVCHSWGPSGDSSQAFNQHSLPAQESL